MHKHFVRGGLCLALGWIWACTGTGMTDAGPGDSPDAGPTCNADNLPAPSDPCLAENPCGNEKAVGQTCSSLGAECSANGIGNAIFCTVDFSDTTLHFCTRPCVLDEDCGSGAECAVDPDDPDSEAGCVPTACVGDPEDAGPGLDAGLAPDAGMNDAGPNADGGA